MASISPSPVQIGTSDVTFPDMTFSRLTIRIASGSGTETLVKRNSAASATNADMILYPGDVLTILGRDIVGGKGSNVHIKNLTGDPKIYWSMS